jgi:hypothetical protein
LLPVADAAAVISPSRVSHHRKPRAETSPAPHCDRQLTGLTPRRFVASQRTTIAAAFRRATGGGPVYF